MPRATAALVQGVGCREGAAKEARGKGNELPFLLEVSLRNVKETGQVCFLHPETLGDIHLCSSLGIPGGFGLDGERDTSCRMGRARAPSPKGVKLPPGPHLKVIADELLPQGG